MDSRELTAFRDETLFSLIGPQVTSDIHRRAYIRLLTAAQGFSELGMWEDAWDELEKLKVEERDSPAVLWLRLGILSGLQEWDRAASMAEEIVAQGCKSASPYILGAYAMRHARTVREAREFLERGALFVREQPSWHFLHACYDCQLGDLAAAKLHLGRAFALQPHLFATALVEGDLAPLWESMR